MAWLTFLFLLFRVEAQAGGKAVANTIILVLKNVNLTSLFFRKVRNVYTKYPRLINLLPDCEESVLSKSLRWFENQLQRVLVILLTPCSTFDSKWGDEITMEPGAKHLWVPLSRTQTLEAVLRTPRYFMTQPARSPIPTDHTPYLLKGAHEPRASFFSPHSWGFTCLGYTELVHQAACNFSRPVECLEEEKQHCLNLLKR